MRIKAWGPLVAVLLFGTGVAVLWVQTHSRGASSQTIQRHVDAPANADVGAERRLIKRQNVEEGFRFTDWLLVGFNGLLALFTYQLFLATTGLVKAASEQSKDTKESIRAATEAVQNGITANQIAVTNSERQLRAYVTARDLNVIPHRLPGRVSPIADIIVEGAVHTYRIGAILRNGGQTPAINVVTNVSCRPVQAGIPFEFDFPDSANLGHGLIGPDSEFHTPYIAVSARTFEEIDGINEWYLWGWVEYDDIFGSDTRHRTEFCFEIGRLRLEATNDLWMAFKPFSRFNAMDSDCLRPIEPTR
jgi:hypothetical protein